MTCMRKKMYCDDEEVVIEALKYDNRNVFECLSSDLKNDKEIVSLAFRTSGDLIRYASEELRNDKETVLLAMKGCPGAFQHASSMDCLPVR